MKKINAMLVAGLVSLVPVTSAFAGNMSAGVAFGQASFSEDDFDSSTAFKLSGAYGINKNFAIEGGYTSLGKFENDTTGAEASVEVKGFEVSAVGIMPLDDTFSLFARGGLFIWDADAEVTVTIPFVGTTTASGTDDGNDIVVGFGLDTKVASNMTVRAEYDSYAIDDTDAAVFTVGLNYAF